MEQRISFYKEHYDVIVIGGDVRGFVACQAREKRFDFGTPQPSRRRGDEFRPRRGGDGSEPS